MVIIKGLLILLMFVICPLLTGDIIKRLTKTGENGTFDNLVYRYVFGNVTMWAVFELIAVPLILMKISFMAVVYIWCALMLIIVIGDIAMLVFNKINGEHTGISLKINLKEIIKDKENIFTAVIIIAAILIIGYQCYNYVAYMHIDDDDSRFVVNACEAYDNDSMLLINPATGEYEGTWVGELAKDVTSPWSIYVAMIAKIIQIYPTIVFHTILPIFLVLMGYGVYWLLSKKLFKNNIQSSALFIFFAALINMYFNASVYTSSTFFLIRIWQGKAVVAGVMMPLMLYLLYSIYQKSSSYGKYAVLVITNIAGCLLSGTGIFFCPIITGVYGLYYMLVKKKWSRVVLVLLTCIPSCAFALLYAFLK